ncbi:hypothetical protein CY35_09G077100 [Sphagnum magellanicum]|nr:hypothetical protein CY35_09G077100 [Sphagnum magellanicum]
MAKLQKSLIQLLLSLWLCSILLQYTTTTAARILLPTNSKIKSKTEDSFGSRDNTGGFQINNGNMEFLHEESGGGRGEEEGRGGGGESVVGTNSRPLIGILSQPSCGECETEADWTSNRSCIAASYVKFVESAGARAVPLLYNEPEESLIKKFAAINGILFPGGATSLDDNPFYQTAEKLFKMVIESNDNGDYFPLYGACLGFQLLTVIVSQNHSILGQFEAAHRPAPLLLVGDWVKNHSIFQWVPRGVVDKISKQPLAMENHHEGVSPQTWFSNGLLTDFFHVLTTTQDNNGKMYISTVESQRYPILGVQWHPEPPFEWGDVMIPHSVDAVQLTQAVANYFISEARKSQHKPISIDEERELMMYNYKPFYSNKDGHGSFEQEYWINL